MGISYHIDETQHLIILTAEGRLTSEVLLAGVKKVLDDPIVEPGIRAIFDLRGVQGFEISTWTIRAAAGIAHSAEKKLTGSKMAIIASKSVVYGMARMYQILRDGSPAQIKVFRTISEAETWLCLQAESVETQTTDFLK